MAKKLHPLKAYRKKAKLSANAMAKKVGMTRASIERIERYDQLPPLATITRFVEASGKKLKVNDFLPPKARKVA